MRSIEKGPFARALKKVSDWSRRNRHLPISEQLHQLTRKLMGHYFYYGITGNFRRLANFGHQVIRVWRKWLAPGAPRARCSGLVQPHDPVRETQVPLPMTDDHERLSAKPGVQRVHQRVGDFLIQPLGGLIQDKHGSLLQKGPGNSQASGFARGKLVPSFAHGRLQARGQGGNETGELRRFHGGPDFLLISHAAFGQGKREVVTDGSMKEERRLRHHGKKPACVFAPERPQLYPPAGSLQGDASLLVVPESKEQVHQCALSDPAGA